MSCNNETFTCQGTFKRQLIWELDTLRVDRGKFVSIVTNERISGPVHIHKPKMSMLLTNSVFWSCYSNRDGGGINIDAEDGDATFLKCCFSDCSAKRKGQAIYFSWETGVSSFAVNDTVITLCARYDCGKSRASFFGNAKNSALFTGGNLTSNMVHYTCAGLYFGNNFDICPLKKAVILNTNLFNNTAGWHNFMKFLFVKDFTVDQLTLLRNTQYEKCFYDGGAMLIFTESKGIITNSILEIHGDMSASVFGSSVIIQDSLITKLDKIGICMYVSINELRTIDCDVTNFDKTSVAPPDVQLCNQLK